MNWVDIENAALAAGLELSREPVPGIANDAGEPVTRIVIYRPLPNEGRLVESIQNAYWSETPGMALYLLERIAARRA
jgi:hypothetical protein